MLVKDIGAVSWEWLLHTFCIYHPPKEEDTLLKE